MFSFVKKPPVFQSRHTIFHSHQQWVRITVALHLHQYLVLSVLYFTCCNKRLVVSVCFICNFLMTFDVELLFICLFNICISLFYFILFIYLFIYFWLCWVFVTVRGFSLVVASGGHSSSRCAGLSLSRPLVAEHRLQTRRLSSCGSRA